MGTSSGAYELNHECSKHKWFNYTHQNVI